MKRRTVGFMLALSLALTMISCGKQEAEQEREDIVYEEDEEEYEEENKYGDIIGKEFENDDIYIKIENTEQTVGFYEEEWEDAYGQLVADKDIPVYCDGGFQVGYIKTGATIDITEHGIYNGNSSAYYRFPNPIEGIPFDYLYVSYLDCNYEYFKVETESSIKEAAEWEQAKADEESERQQTQDAHYDEILEDAGYDKDKTYTAEEYIEVLTKICEVLGKGNNPDLFADYQDSIQNKKSFEGYHVERYYNTYDFSDHEQTLQNTQWTIDYLEMGRDGLGGITEFCIVEGQKDEEKTINVIVKVDHSKLEY